MQKKKLAFEVIPNWPRYFPSRLEKLQIAVVEIDRLQWLLTDGRARTGSSLPPLHCYRCHRRNWSCGKQTADATPTGSRKPVIALVIGFPWTRCASHNVTRCGHDWPPKAALPFIDRSTGLWNVLPSEGSIPCIAFGRSRKVTP
jgi:hypothetical protein